MGSGLRRVAFAKRRVCEHGRVQSRKYKSSEADSEIESLFDGSPCCVKFAWLRYAADHIILCGIWAPNYMDNGLRIALVFSPYHLL